jgi:serine/threonine protein kinase
MKSLEQEVCFASKLRHPHIVLVYGACIFSPTELWIVMEFADGGNLTNTLIDLSKVTKKEGKGNGI